jgi:hypothetical protein
MHFLQEVYRINAQHDCNFLVRVSVSDLENCLTEVSKISRWIVYITGCTECKLRPQTTSYTLSINLMLKNILVLKMNTID